MARIGRPPKRQSALKSIPRASRSGAGKPDMRDSIKDVATKLLILHGVNGTSYGEIAERLKTTTTNIHYHFGNKQALVDEVVADYVIQTQRRHLAIWLDQATTLPEKIQRVAAYNYERYRQFNASDEGHNSWSLIGRLRLESDVLSNRARNSLASFTQAIHEGIRVAVDTAWKKGELQKDAPREDLAFLLINIVNSSSVFTQGVGGFSRLQLFFDTFSRAMLFAYAPKAKKS